jgi:hypothetical protein
VRRFVPLSICLLILLCAISAFVRYEGSRIEIRRLEIQVAVLLEKTTELQRQLAKSERELKAAERSSQEAKAVNQAGVTSPVRMRVPGMDGLEMLRNPASAPLWRKLERRAEKHVYGDFVAAMKLPPTEEAHLWDLMEERSESVMDAAIASKQEKLSDQDTEKEWHATEAEANGRIESLIGPDNFRILQLDEGFGSPGMLVTSTIGVDLARAGSPLTPDQIVHVAESYGDAHMVIGQDSGVPSGQVPDPVTGLTPYFQTLLDKVSQSLTPDQETVVKGFYLEQVQLQLYKEEQASRTR